MEKFHGIEFELPKDYLLVNKADYLSFINTTIGYLDAWIDQDSKQTILEGSQVLIFKDEKIRPDSEMNVIPKELIRLKRGYTGYPISASEEEYLIELKDSIERGGNPTDQIVKCEISKIFNFAKFPTYRKIIDEFGTTYYFHDFFPSEGNDYMYSIQLSLTKDNDDSELSKENFNKILNSIEIK